MKKPGIGIAAASIIMMQINQPPVVTDCRLVELNEFVIISGVPWTDCDFQWSLVWNVPENNYIDVTVFQQKSVDGKLKQNRYTQRRMK